MTYLQIVNSVLRRLREDEVASVSENNYSKLIGDFVNEAKREVEDAWNWNQLRTTIQVTCTPSTWRYTLTGAGNRHRIMQVVNDTNNHEMHKASYTWMNLQFTGDNPSEGSPIYWDINGNTSGDPDVDLYPIPNTADVINFNMVIPQDDLSSDSDTLTVSQWPVILGAFAKAVSERGEDGSTQFAEAMGNYQHALSDAISLDAYHLPAELNWTVN